jgi:hypothetical protein
MTKATTTGIALGVGLIVIVAVVVFRTGVSRDGVIPAAIGLPNGEDDDSGREGSRVTRYPVVVSPKDVDEARGLGAASPARGPTHLERSPAARETTAAPDSFSPRSTILPIPDSLDTGGTVGGFGGRPGWPDGRNAIVPATEGLQSETPEIPGAARHSVGELPGPRINMYVPPVRR